ncbi:hypothetical protein AHAS_Ahas06G0004600 [Arachis hypogaea]
MSIRGTLQLPTPTPLHQDHDKRMDKDRRYDQVLVDICLLGAQWRMGVDGYLNRLRRNVLKPVARGWLEFIQRSIIPISNCSECIVVKAIMIHYIMIGQEMVVEDIIPQ